MFSLDGKVEARSCGILEDSKTGHNEKIIPVKGNKVARPPVVFMGLFTVINWFQNGNVIELPQGDRWHNLLNISACMKIMLTIFTS